MGQTEQIRWYKQSGWRATGRVIVWLITIAATGAAVVLATYAGVDLNARAGWLWAAAGAAVIPVVISAVREAASRRARRRLADEVDEATARLMVAMGAGLTPPLVSLGQMAAATTMTRRSELMGAINQAVVNAAAGLCGPRGQDVRAVYFRREGNTNTMKQVAFSGTTEPSPRTFVNHAADVAGKAAWDFARTGSAKLYEDLGQQTPVGFTPSATTNYETFLTVGVVADGQVFGMLNVDAPVAGDLGESDLKVAALLARVLAVGNVLMQVP